MIKKLLFIAALLIPGLAHAANPTATLSVNIVPAAQAGTVPAPAQAAGFTTTVLDYDFTQSNPWSNTTNWLRCHNGSGAATPLFYQNWVGFGGAQMPSCSNITWGLDPLGVNAVHLHMDLAQLQAMPCYPSCGGNVTAMTMDLVDGSGNGNKVPSNSYYEVTGLIKTSDSTMTHLFADFWSYSLNSAVEWDGIEWFGANTGFATYHNNAAGQGNSTNEHNSLDTSAYHKYEWRVTQDGSSNGYFCSYIDDLPAGSSPGNCIPWHPTAGQLSGETSSTMQFETGFAGCAEPSPACPNSSVDIYVRRLRVFSCAGLNSGARCLTANPNP